MKRVFQYPIWLGELFTGAKSFKANPLIGNDHLNRYGLHVGRVWLAYWMSRLRMAMLAPGVPWKTHEKPLYDGLRSDLPVGVNVVIYRFLIWMTRC